MRLRWAMSIELSVMIVIITGFLLYAARVNGAETPTTTNRQPRVLVIYSNERLLPASIDVDEAIRATFKSELQVHVEFYTEFLDVDRFPGEEQPERTRDYLKDRYRERPPDIIIAGGAAALDFLLRHRATLFPSVPVVQCGVAPTELPQSLPDDLIVGIPQDIDVAATV